MYKLVFFVPTEHAEEVKAAVFSTGAGKIGHYDQCCWQTTGTGQFRPLAGSDPFIGQAPGDQPEGETEYVEELRIELVCEDALIRDAVFALKNAHPYEEPAYDVWQLASF